MIESPLYATVSSEVPNDNWTEDQVLSYYAQHTAILETETRDKVLKARKQRGPCDNNRLYNTFKENCDKQINGTAKCSWIVQDVDGVYWLEPKINNVKMARDLIKIGKGRADAVSKIRSLKIAADHSDLMKTAIAETARECLDARKQDRVTRNSSGKAICSWTELLKIPAKTSTEEEPGAEVAEAEAGEA